MAAKIWLNGNLIESFAPEAKPVATAPKAATGEEFDLTNVDVAGFDPETLAKFQQSRRGGARGKEHELHIGLRQGENHLVIKIIGEVAAPSPSRRGNDNGKQAEVPMRCRGSSGTAFRFTITPEGDDILNYETTLAVLARKHDEHKPVALDAAAIQKATTLTKKSEKKPTLTPAERRAKVVRDWYRSNIDVAGRVLAAELRKLERQKNELEAKLPSAMVMEELDTPRVTDIFIRGDYRNRHSDYGWEIADYGFSRRGLGLASLRPMQWQNHLDFMIAARNQAFVTADGLRNARRLL